MFEDVKELNPQFVRIARDRGDNIIFDFNGVEYLARDKEKYGELELDNYLTQLDDENAIYEYHISLRSADKKRALLIFESDKLGGDDVILKLTRLIRERGVKFILKSSGNRSLHLCIPIISETEEEYNKQWLGVFYLLGVEERELIDEQLNKFSGQIRGFYSLHLKTYKHSEVLEDE